MVQSSWMERGGRPCHATTCHHRGVERRQAMVVYYGFAIALGLLVGVTRAPGLPFFVLLLAGGVAAAFVRSQWLGARAWSRVDLSWGLVFVVTFLPSAWIARTWPFA